MIIRHTILAAFLAALFGGFYSPPVPAGEFSEYEVKAALLYRAAKFVRWNSDAEARRNLSFRICVLGSARTVDTISKLEGKRINSRDVDVRRVTAGTARSERCDVLFFSENEDVDPVSVVEGLQRPVLTVGESREFVEASGVMSMLLIDNRMQILINQQAAEASDIEFSSQLLRMAVLVGKNLEAASR